MAVAHLALLAATTHDYARAARRAARRDRARRAVTAGSGRGPPAPPTSRWRPRSSCGTGGDDAARTLARAREALASTQERPLRAGLALLARRCWPPAASWRPRSPCSGRASRSWATGRCSPKCASSSPCARRCCGPSSASASRRCGCWRRRGAEPADARRGRRARAAPARRRRAGGGARATIAAWAAQLEQQTARRGAGMDRRCAGARGARRPRRRGRVARAGARPGRARRAALGAARLRPPAAAAAAAASSGAAPRTARWSASCCDALDATNGRSRSAAPLVIEPLSPRERAVLRYLPTMMSNQEIASELFVSVNTVKTHLKAIYRKLDVPNRREAVAARATLELLAPSPSPAAAAPRPAPGRAPGCGRSARAAPPGRGRGRG